MSKIKVAFITGSICILLGIGGGTVFGWYLFKCVKGTVEAGEPSPLSPTEWKDTPDQNTVIPPARYCGDHIDIYGAMRQGNFFVTAEDDCKRNSRAFPMKAKCPASVRPYSVMIQPFILAGYNRELSRFDAMAGIQLSFLWNYSRGSVGLGVMYAQGIIYDEYYIGASFVGVIDFGKLK